MGKEEGTEARRSKRQALVAREGRYGGSNCQPDRQGKYCIQIPISPLHLPYQAQPRAPLPNGGDTRAHPMKLAPIQQRGVRMAVCRRHRLSHLPLLLPRGSVAFGLPIVPLFSPLPCRCECLQQERRRWRQLCCRQWRRLCWRRLCWRQLRRCGGGCRSGVGGGAAVQRVPSVSRMRQGGDDSGWRQGTCP